ncbi:MULTISPECIES: zinc ribbon domain-containing protein [Bradyrhizobium]|uniref:zinc ribbon domain-containing protein n=1 Tax=Bradyrhizobium TaxID=374 RepID=UPI000400C3B4|nr:MULTISPECIES: zinc ribbon domain-containing protein [Bradyrhizobium]UFW48208.1 zinc ribbon domain-containing protein [Bradyrhizobium arachidis]
MSTTTFDVRKPCPLCGKPMKRMPDDAAKGRDRYVCTNCDGVDPLDVDPLENPVARRWADGPLKLPGA